MLKHTYGHVVVCGRACMICMLFGCTIQFFYLSAIAYIKKPIKYPWIEIACAQIVMLLTSDHIYKESYPNTYTRIQRVLSTCWWNPNKMKFGKFKLVYLMSGKLGAQNIRKHLDIISTTCTQISYPIFLLYTTCTGPSIQIMWKSHTRIHYMRIISLFLLP